MRYPLLSIIMLLVAPALGQVITQAQQKALNAYVDYANQSAEEVTAVVKSIMNYYPEVHREKRFSAPRYVCPIQLEDYYLKTARDLSKSIPPKYAVSLTARLNALREASEQIDAKCKELDTYHKLEDYKQDNFEKANQIIVALQDLVGE